MAIARADGSNKRKLQSLARIDLLVVDDWEVAPLSPENARDLLELLDDRYQARSTLISALALVESWHQLIGDPTIAGAALDRIVHNARRIELTGESMRKTRLPLTNTPVSHTRDAQKPSGRFRRIAQPGQQDSQIIEDLPVSRSRPRKELGMCC